LENVIENENVTRALKHEGIDIVDNLAYHDPTPNIQKLQKLKIGEIGLIKSFIHYVHFCEETNPIGNDWKSITMDDLTNSGPTLHTPVDLHLCHLCHHLI
jgi:hypothetical protein